MGTAREVEPRQVWGMPRAGWMGLLILLPVALGCPPEGAVVVPPSPSAVEPRAPEDPASREPLVAADEHAALERLTSDPTDELFPVRSPDAASALVLYQAEGYEPGSHKLASQLVYGIDPDKRDKKTLYTREDRAFSQPSFFADGHRLALVSNETGPLAVVRMSATPGATGAVLVTSELAPGLAEPAVSPDGTRVAISMTDPSGARVIALVKTEGAPVAPTIVGEGRAPAWSPKGDKLAIVRTVAGYNHVFIGPPEGPASAFAPVTHGDFDCDRPSFSPDGARLVLSSNHGFKELGRERATHLQLFVVPTGGGELVPLTKGRRRAATPSWASDGWIYFASDRDGSFDIFRIRAPDGPQR